MIFNDNFSVLPFYDSINKQSHRKSYAYGETSPTVLPRDRFIPFQLVTDSTISTIVANSLDGKVSENITLPGITTVAFDGYLVTTIPGNVITPLQRLPVGQYYLEASGWYSEVFSIVNSVGDYLRLSWWDDTDVILGNGRIRYENGFKNILYISAQLGKPSYPFVEEGEDRDGLFFAAKQISEKKYSFTFLAPEYILDALRLVRMSDHVLITDMYGTEYKVDTILLTPKWQTQGDLASVEVEFETNTVIKKL